MNRCPRCASEITEFDEFCPRCGLKIDENSKKNRKKRIRNEKRELKKQRKLEKKQAKEQRESVKTDFTDYMSTEYMTRKQKQSALNFDIDSNGEYDINTEDVEIIDNETKKLLEKQNKQTYSIKKARGEYEPEKIKWWELYKLANRAFARRKIKKEVNKASKIKPEYISKSKLLILAILLGWSGAHNFYAKNKRKGFVSLICFFIWFGLIIFSPNSAFLSSIELSIGGLSGFIVMFIWITDSINIIFNSFKYRSQKISFISNLNIETRAKLGEKYIDMNLYQSPWYKRLKVWLEKRKRNYAEFKHERRQNKIEKEKIKQKKREEQEKIDAEILEFEEKENQKLKMQKIADQVDKEALEDMKSLDKELNSEKKIPAKKQAKIKISKKKK